MDILLINSPIFYNKTDPNSTINVPALGLGYIYTQLKLSGYECGFIDAVVQNLNPKKVIYLINSSDARYVGLNIFSSNLNIVRLIIENSEPNKTFVLGGPSVASLLPEIKGWNFKGELIIITGEAELIIPEVIANPIKFGVKENNIRTIHVDAKSEYFPTNIDLPLDRKIFINEPVYKHNLGLVESHIISSRGCVYNCAFCSAATSLNKHLYPRYRTYDSLNAEIKVMQENHSEINCIRILDDLFLRNSESIKQAISLFTERKLNWRCMAHVNTFKDLSNAQLEEIKDSNCRELFVGIESGNDDVLRRIRKPFTSDVALGTIKKILDAHIPVKCYFILGFPGETEDNLKDTFKLASRMSEHANKINTAFRISVFRFRPYHGTRLYNDLVNSGIVVNPIANRADIFETASYDPFDCVSGVYAEYKQDVLEKYISEMEQINEQKESNAD